ncbi:MAG: nitrogen fixation protein NifX [Rhodocyclaceae bacterium]|nr:nitrogen fixation protein NifX [Rhodocyclaceae bacterium]MCP5235823.1 nitrogen fixation protein NifX [Zoogloeaceae bacterium]
MNLSIAFASSDRETVDQHFGAAAAFAIFELGAHGSRLREVAEFIDTAMDGHEGKLDAKIALLEGCAAVYACAIGSSAVQRLLAKGVQPLKVANGSPIDALLSQLRSELDGTPPIWLARAVGLRQKRSPDRFDAMAGEGWEE